MSERLLVLVRHGQSEWNLKNLFTGWRDVDLTEKGVNEAREAMETARLAAQESRVRREAPSYLTACGLAMRRFLQ